MNQRGFVLVEFVIALPLLIWLLYLLGTLTLQAAKIAREQVADYVLETEAQEIIDRIITDARTACYIKIQKSDNDLENIILKCNTLSQAVETEAFRQNELGKFFQYRNIDEASGIEATHINYHKNILDTRIYAVYSVSGVPHVYFKRQEDNSYNNPIIGENSFGNTLVTQLKFSVLAPKVLHVMIELKSYNREQKVKFSTAVYIPGCEKIEDKGNVYTYE